MARTSTVSRTLAECRKRGWPCAKLEHWLALDAVADAQSLKRVMGAAENVCRAWGRGNAPYGAINALGDELVAAVKRRRYPGGGRRVDLWGFGDVLAIRRPGYLGALLIQSTAGRGDVAAHMAKLRDLVRSYVPPKTAPDLPEPLTAWLSSNNRLAIWSWAQRGDRGKRKLWTVVEHDITLEEIER